MTADSLKALNVKDLSDLARRRGVRGWQGMRKDQLVKALVRTGSQNKPSQGAAAAKTVKAVVQMSQAKSTRPSAVRRAASSAKASVAHSNHGRSMASKPHPATTTSGGRSAKVSANGKSAGRTTSAAAKTLTAKTQSGKTKPVVSAKAAAKPTVVVKPATKPNSKAKNVAPSTPAVLASGTNKMPAASKTNGAAKPVVTTKSSALRPAAVEPARDSAVAKKLQQMRSKTDRLKNLSSNTPQDRPGGVRDRLVVMVRDSFWLHAFWELSRRSIERAEAALGQEWHCAKPILRLYEVSEGGTTSAAETAVRDIDIHGGVSNWYIDVPNPPRSYRLDIGYVTPSGKIFLLVRSNVVSTPRPGVKDALDENWTAVAENYDKIYAMSGGYDQDGSAGALKDLFEERLRRPMGSPMSTRFGGGVESLLPSRRNFHFDIEAELIVYGRTEADGHVTLQGEPVKLRPDGSFTMRFSLPNARQVIPAVACSANGLEQRTIVLAVERNTKVMEPLVRDSNE